MATAAKRRWRHVRNAAEGARLPALYSLRASRHLRLALRGAAAPVSTHGTLFDADTCCLRASTWPAAAALQPLLLYTLFAAAAPLYL